MSTIATENSILDVLYESPRFTGFALAIISQYRGKPDLVWARRQPVSLNIVKTIFHRYVTSESTSFLGDRDTLLRSNRFGTSMPPPRDIDSRGAVAAGRSAESNINNRKQLQPKELGGSVVQCSSLPLMIQKKRKNSCPKICYSAKLYPISEPDESSDDSNSDDPNEDEKFQRFRERIFPCNKRQRRINRAKIVGFSFANKSRASRRKAVVSNNLRFLFFTPEFEPVFYEPRSAVCYALIGDSAASTVAANPEGSNVDNETNISRRWIQWMEDEEMINLQEESTQVVDKSNSNQPKHGQRLQYSLTDFENFETMNLPLLYLNNMFGSSSPDHANPVERRESWITRFEKIKKSEKPYLTKNIHCTTLR